MDKKKFIIEEWSDFRCPFCFIAYSLLKKLKAEIADKADFDVVHRSYELYPDAPAEPDNTILDSYSRKYGLSKAEAEEKIAAITEAGRKAGINNFNYGGAVPSNSFDAHRLCKYGTEQGHPEIYERLMEAYFCDNVNIASAAMLLDTAQECGLSRDDTERMLLSGRYASEVRADEQLARSLGIRSVPCFVVDGRQFMGSGCMGQLKAWLLR